MSKIHLLDEEVINKIAAGEVIERPASVVKELVENALDAGATKITVEIKCAGKELMRITDNGCGMEPEDAQKALLRHATSKIKDADDLSALSTLGFRGEALASIAAVSLLRLTTKTAHALEGLTLLNEGGRVIESGICAAQQGTSLEVKNIFFNTPVRKKFLKTDAVEAHHCIDVLTRYALIHPEVSFTFLNENKVLLQTPALSNLRETIAAVYGTLVAKELVLVQQNNGGISVSGFVSSPYNVRNDTAQQTLSVNKRWVKSEEITAAVYEAYHSLLFVGKHPLFVLHLEVDADKIDVNVHPNKLAIKFEQKELVQEVVKQAIVEAFQKNNLFPTVKEEQQLAFGNSENFSSLRSKNSGVKYAFEQSTQQTLEREPAPQYAAIEHAPAVISEQNPLQQQRESEDSLVASASLQQQPVPHPELYSKLPPIRLLGQIHKTFFVAETEGGFLLIDQHAAHERAVYEQFMAQFMKEEVAVQELLQGEVIEFSPADALVVAEYLPLLQRFGFLLEPFGEKTFVMKTIPSILGRTQEKEALLEILAKLQEKNMLKEMQETIVTRMACRAAVMAGEELTNERMKGILQELSRCKLPFTCPHGRPTMIKTDVEELEKKFRRK